MLNKSSQIINNVVVSWKKSKEVLSSYDEAHFESGPKFSNHKIPLQIAIVILKYSIELCVLFLCCLLIQLLIDLAKKCLYIYK